MSGEDKSGGAAFPRQQWIHPQGSDYGIDYGETGMTMRQWYAGQALIGEIASMTTEESVAATVEAAHKAGRTIEAQVAFNCFKLADSMIAAEKGKKP